MHTIEECFEIAVARAITAADIDRAKFWKVWDRGYGEPITPGSLGANSQRGTGQIAPIRGQVRSPDAESHFGLRS